MSRDEQAKKLVESLRPLRLQGKRFPCPRCGRDTMKTDSPATNALSRYANVYICDACGTEEAMDDMVGQVLPLTEWSMPRSFLGGGRNG